MLERVYHVLMAMGVIAALDNFSHNAYLDRTGRAIFHLFVLGMFVWLTLEWVVKG